MEILSKITITCFAASYGVVFGLELSRVFFASKTVSTRVQRFLKIGFAAAGLFAHTVYLIFNSSMSLDLEGLWLGNWFAWCLATAWLLMAAYLWMALRKHETAIGLLLLPLTLFLIWSGLQFGNANQFSPRGARSIWSMAHGAALLLGTTVVLLGFIFGIVYLIQASRLKQKKVASRSFRMPSLEWLQRSSERSLLISAIFLGVGLLSGIALNQVPGDGKLEGKIAWSDPVIWSSGVLFLWLLAATLFNLFYRPARQGRKVAYLVVASFLFLMLELGIVWWVGHATEETGPSGIAAACIAEESLCRTHSNSNIENLGALQKTDVLRNLKSETEKSQVRPPLTPGFPAGRRLA